MECVVPVSPAHQALPRMIFVDGENLAIRYGTMLGEIPLSNTYNLKKISTFGHQS